MAVHEEIQFLPFTGFSLSFFSFYFLCLTIECANESISSFLGLSRNERKEKEEQEVTTLNTLLAFKNQFALYYNVNLSGQIQ